MFHFLLASPRWLSSHLPKFILKNLSLTLTKMYKCDIIWNSQWVLFYYVLRLKNMSDVAHQGCTQWFDFTKSLDPRYLSVSLVSSKMKKSCLPSAVIMLPVSTLATEDRRGRTRQASFTCYKLDTHTHTQKSIVWNFADISYCAARLATTRVCFLRGNVAQCCRTVCTGGEDEETLRAQNSLTSLSLDLI